MAINPWRYYELIKQSKELDNQIVLILGKDKFEELEKYAFEFACEEAKLLGITREGFKGEIEYMVAFNRLCRFRREVILRDIFMSAKNLEKQLGGDISLKDSVELNPDYSSIPSDVRKIYRGG